MFKDYIMKILKELGLEEGPALARELSSFALNIDGVEVLMLDRAPGIEYSATLGYLPEDRTEEMLVLLLRGNFLGQATRQAYLSLDETGSQIVAHMFIPTVRSFREFQDALEDFANVISFWKSQLMTPTP